MKLTDIYVNADKTKQTAYDDSIKKGQVVVNDSFTSQDKVDDAVKIITDSIVALRVSAAEAAVKAAEDAAQAGKDKKAEVEADGVVNPDEKSAVDGLNDVTTEKKGTATPLVDSLPEGPVKEALKARLDQVTTSEVTVNDADSNGKPDSQDAAEAAAEAAVKAAEDAAQAGKDKKAEVEADGVVNPDEKSAVDGLNDVTTEKKGTATPLVDSLPEGPVKEALKARLDQVTTSEVTVNDADSNGKPDSQDAAEAAAEAAVKAAEDAAQAGKDKKAEVEADGVVNPDEKSAVDGLNDVTTEKKVQQLR
ncbi:GA-like domain-containing protein [Streptococcus canis]|uniref:GA-like domain-containing protein n=1 Tax=Streptococcus canis TaxID=1329 RepID=UPI000F6CBB52|nr:hypothetical protein [Streptococcus canis]VEE25861.1 Uncharacterised protein [Streptococcus canis]